MKEKLQEYALIAEIISAIAIFASLIFVGLQIQQNTEVVKMEAYNFFVSQTTENLHVITTDPIFASLNLRVTTGDMPEDFTDLENFQIRAGTSANLRVWTGLFQSVDAGILPPSYLEFVGQGGAFNNPYFRSVWPSMRSLYSDNFVEFFESLEWYLE